MASVAITDDGSDVPRSECSSCGVFYNLSWHLNPVYEKPDFCPFCGEEIDEFIQEETPNA